MRPYGLVEEAFEDEEDELPRVVRIVSGDRSRQSPFGAQPGRQPWTPRDAEVPESAVQEEPSPLTVRKPGLSRTHQLMIGSFAVICAGMVLGMLMVRVWDDASRAVAALPPNGSSAPERGAAPAAPVVPAEPAPLPGTGAITTEIRVLQPNYTVAPGDTLGIIARRHGTSIDALASINNLENRNSLGVGQKLIIP